MKAIYHSVWDGGIDLPSACEFDPETKVVSDIETTYDVNVEHLEEEYLELPDGSTLKRSQFKLEDDEEDDGEGDGVPCVTG